MASKTEKAQEVKEAAKAVAPAKPAAAAPAQNVPAGAGRALAAIGLFSILMITLPIGLYFASFEGYLDGLYAMTIGVPAPDQRAVASAILAVLGVNLVVGGFVFYAFQEVNDDPKARAAKAAKAKGAKAE